MPSLFHHQCKRSVSPYINHFLQPDTIIPSPASPQSWNRYSYVLNNPINASDPSGHKCVSEPEECLSEKGTPINGAGGLSGGSQSDGGGAGGGGDAGDLHDRHKPWKHHSSLSVDLAVNALSLMAPDPNSDYPYDTNVPYIPGVSPGIKGPMPLFLCTGPAAGFACLASVITSVLPSAPSIGSYNSNFSIAINAEYKESFGIKSITLSDIQIANRNRVTLLIDVNIGKQTIYGNRNYLSTDGTYRPISNTGGSYNGDYSLSIELTAAVRTLGPHGPVYVPKVITIFLPSVPELRNAIGE